MILALTTTTYIIVFLLAAGFSFLTAQLLFCIIIKQSIIPQSVKNLYGNIVVPHLPHSIRRKYYENKWLKEERLRVKKVNAYFEGVIPYTENAVTKITQILDNHIERVRDSIKKLSLTDKEKQKIIMKALKTEKGAERMGQVMAAPIIAEPLSVSTNLNQDAWGPEPLPPVCEDIEEM